MGEFWVRAAQAIGLGLAALLLGLGIALHDEVPRWHSGGSDAVAAASVGYLLQPLACPAPGTRIAVIGDSHVSGSRMEPGGMPFAAVLEQALAGRITAMRLGVGGETAAVAEQRAPSRDLAGFASVMLMLGTNDAAPRGWVRDKQPVPLTAFRASLTRQIGWWRARGLDVVLLAPPPGGSAAIAARLQPYRHAVRDVGRASGVAVLDPADAFVTCPSDAPLLTRDALHMSAAGHRCLGQWLAQQFCPARLSGWARPAPSRRGARAAAG